MVIQLVAKLGAQVGLADFARIVMVSLAATAIAEAAEQPAIALAPLLPGERIDIDRTENYTGRCGSAVVRVMGVTSFVGGTFAVAVDAGRIIVRPRAGLELIIDQTNGLSDYSGIACLDSPKGARLLLWTRCAGSGCSDEFSFLVIDPAQAKVLAPKRPGHSTCDEECASRIVGSDLPHRVSPD